MAWPYWQGTVLNCKYIVQYTVYVYFTVYTVYCIAKAAPLKVIIIELFVSSDWSSHSDDVLLLVPLFSSDRSSYSDGDLFYI